MANAILTITLNPAVDKHFFVAQMIPDDKIRCENPRIDAGGGGINVAKAIVRMGRPVDAFFLSGGANGHLLENLLLKEGIHLLSFPLNSNTRENVIITEISSNKQFRLVTKGPWVDSSTAEQLFSHLAPMMGQYPYVVASGSLPDGIADNFYARLAEVAHEAGSRFIVDTAGNALALALQKNIFMCKPSLNELCLLLGVEKLEIKDIPAAAKDLMARYKVEIIVVSLGKEGAFVITKNGHHHIAAPLIERKSTVGAGDSMVGGMVWALNEGKTIDEMMKIGIACGSAATLQEGTQLFALNEVEKLLKQMG